MAPVWFLGGVFLTTVREMAKTTDRRLALWNSVWRRLGRSGL
jgi:hypothetical protein